MNKDVYCKKRILLMGMLISGLLFLTVSCDYLLEEDLDEDSDFASNEIVELSLYTYYVDTDVEIVDYAIKVIEEKYPISIEVIHRSDATGIELKTMAAVNKLPDIYEVTGETVIDTFIASGDIAPMEATMKEMEVMEIVKEVSLNSLYNSDGHIYAMSFEPPRNFLIYYNQQVFDQYNLELPNNYQELIEVSNVFVDQGIVPFALFGAEPWPGIQLYDTIVSRYYDKGIKGLINGDQSITDQGFLRAAYQIQELSNLGFFGAEVFSTNASQAFEMFKNGQAAMIGNGNWYLLDIVEYGQGFGYLDNPFAQVGEEEDTLYIRSGGSSEGGWSVNPKGQHVELARQVAVDFCIQRAIASVELYGIANPLTVPVQPINPRHPAVQKYADEIDKFTSTTYFPWNISNAEIASALNDNHQKLISNEITPEEFINNMEQVINGVD